MNRDEYNTLFHRLELNLVAFKRLMDCDEEVLKLVNAAIEAERERIKWDTIHSCHPKCDKPVCVAIRKAVEAEREACAKVCMNKWMEWMDASPDKRLDMRNDAEDCAFAIRERGAP
jgi:hypothetical protein